MFGCSRGFGLKQRPEQSDDQLREVVRSSGQFMGHGLTWALAVCSWVLGSGLMENWGQDPF